MSEIVYFWSDNDVALWGPQKALPLEMLLKPPFPLHLMQLKGSLVHEAPVIALDAIDSSKSWGVLGHLNRLTSTCPIFSSCSMGAKLVLDSLSLFGLIRSPSWSTNLPKRTWFTWLAWYTCFARLASLLKVPLHHPTSLACLDSPMRLIHLNWQT